MTDDAIMHLTPRQYECLSLVAAHISPKQVARSLGLSERTVRGYLTEAIAVLGASDLRDAARIFSQKSNSTPQFVGGIFDGGADDAVFEPSAPVFFTDINNRVAESASPEPYVETGSEFTESTTATQQERLRGLLLLLPTHFFRGNRRANDLSVQQRLIWILIGAFVMMMLLAGATLILEVMAQLSSVNVRVDL